MLPNATNSCQKYYFLVGNEYCTIMYFGPVGEHKRNVHRSTQILSITREN